MQIDLLNGYEGRSKSIDTRRFINLYPELNSQSSKGVASLVATPGLNLFASVAGAIRGAEQMGSLSYFVSAGTLYELNSAGSTTSRGTLNTTSGRVSMSNNGTQLMIVDGTNGYIYTPSTTTFAQIGDADFPNGCQFVDFLDGFFIVENADTNQFNISAAYDGTSWDALDFASAEGNPDSILRCFVDHKELWLFGEYSTEVWYNSGGADFPFAYRTYMEHGCAAPNSVSKADNSVFWLAESERGEKMVVKATGYQPQRISNHSVEFAIDSYSVISDAWGFSYSEEGHSFYVLTFPTAGKTWVYDSSTNLWHERSSKVNQADTRWVPNAYFYAWGKHLVGDYQSGSIYSLSHAAYTDNGVTIQRDFYTNHISNDEERIFIDSIEAVMSRGIGTDTGQGVNPQIMMRHSNDGGYTYGNEKWRDVGKIGKYKTRAKWNRLGMARDHVFHFRMTDPVEWIINGLSAK